MRRKHETDDLFSKRQLSLLYLFLIIEKNLTVSTKMPRKYGISTLKYPKKIWGSRSFKVIDVGTTGKVVSSAFYDKQQVCVYLQPFSR